MITDGIDFRNFAINKNSKLIKSYFRQLLKKKNQVIQSLSINYKDSFKIENIKKYKNFQNLRVIGMGGSSLGSEAIYDFLRKKIKKNLQSQKKGLKLLIKKL